jgi:hypothetical protein
MGVVKNPPGGGPNCTWDLPQDVKDALSPDEAPDAEELKDQAIEAADDEIAALDAEIAKILAEADGGLGEAGSDEQPAV